MKGARQMAQFKLRIPDELLQDLKADAEKNMRSVNAEILYRLKIDQQQKASN